MIRYSQHDKLLKKGRNSTKYCAVQLLLALKDDSNLSNEEVRDRVKKGCISKWEKEDIIRSAHPDATREKH